MRAIKTRDTGPELVVRKFLYSRGFRYRLHDRRLPGRPDIVFKRMKIAMFINGCFWHCHDCAKGRAPKSRLEYWGPKLSRNRIRDAAVESQLQALGWTVITVWQCETNDLESLATRLEHLLSQSSEQLGV